MLAQPADSLSLLPSSPEAIRTLVSPLSPQAASAEPLLQLASTAPGLSASSIKSLGSGREDDEEKAAFSPSFYVGDLHAEVERLSQILVPSTGQRQSLSDSDTDKALRSSDSTGAGEEKPKKMSTSVRRCWELALTMLPLACERLVTCPADEVRESMTELLTNWSPQTTREAQLLITMQRLANLVDELCQRLRHSSVFLDRKLEPQCGGEKSSWIFDDSDQRLPCSKSPLTFSPHPSYNCDDPFPPFSQEPELGIESLPQLAPPEPPAQLSLEGKGNPRVASCSYPTSTSVARSRFNAWQTSNHFSTPGDGPFEAFDGIGVPPPRRRSASLDRIRHVMAQLGFLRSSSINNQNRNIGSSRGQDSTAVPPADPLAPQSDFPLISPEGKQTNERGLRSSNILSGKQGENCGRGFQFYHGSACGHSQLLDSRKSAHDKKRQVRGEIVGVRNHPWWQHCVCLSTLFPTQPVCEAAARENLDWHQVKAQSFANDPSPMEGSSLGGVSSNIGGMRGISRGDKSKESLFSGQEANARNIAMAIAAKRGRQNQQQSPTENEHPSGPALKASSRAAPPPPPPPPTKCSPPGGKLFELSKTPMGGSASYEMRFGPLRKLGTTAGQTSLLSVMRPRYSSLARDPVSVITPTSNAMASNDPSSLLEPDRRSQSRYGARLASHGKVTDLGGLSAMNFQPALAVDAVVSPKMQAASSTGMIPSDSKAASGESPRGILGTPAVSELQAVSSSISAAAARPLSASSPSCAQGIIPPPPPPAVGLLDRDGCSENPQSFDSRVGALQELLARMRWSRPPPGGC